MDARLFKSALALLIAFLAGPVVSRLFAAEPNPKTAEREKKWLTQAQIDADYSERYLAKTGVKSDDKALLDFLRGFPLEETEPAVLARLFEQLGSDDFQTREAATERLCRAVRRVPPEIYTKAKKNDPEVVARLNQWGAAVQQKSFQLEAAKQLLIHRKSLSILRALLKCDSMDVRRAACDALADLRAEAEPAIPELVECLACADWEVAIRAEEALWCIGPKAVEPIVALLDDPRPAIRAHGVRIIGWQVRLGYTPEDGNDVLPRLIEIMKKDDRTVSRVAPRTIAAIAAEGNDKAIQSLIAALKPECDAPGNHKGNHEMPYAEDQLDMDVWTAAAWALADLDLAPKAKTAVPALIEATRSQDHELVRGAVAALGCICCRAKSNEVTDVVPAMVAVFKDKGRPFPTRTNAAGHLGNIGPGAKNAVPGLLGGLEEADGCMRYTCMYALVQIAPDDEAVIDALASIVESTRPFVEIELAAQLLGDIGPAARTAISALRRAKTMERKARPDLIPVLKSTIDGAIQRIEMSRSK